MALTKVIGAAQTDIFGSADGYTLFSGYLVA